MMSVWIRRCFLWFIAAGLVDAHAGEISPVMRAQPFALEEIRLLDGPFQKAMQLDADYLLCLEPDRLLAGFRENSGLEAKAPRYGGWEKDSIAGHSLGHYLSACSLMFASTGDARFLDRVNYILDELELCQERNGDGYVAAIPNGRRVFADIAMGNIRSQGFDLNGLWVPWYTLHKLLAGLLDADLHTRNPKALRIAMGLADWAIQTTDALDEETFQRMLACEHGGMNEVLTELAERTGKCNYLDLSFRFHHQAVLDPLQAQEDHLDGLHANTQIPKVIGAAERYEYVDLNMDHAIASFFWNRIVHHHSYVNGGNSDFEHLGPPDHLSDRLSDNTSETCNTYNMLKLTRHLFCWNPNVDCADYCERALYNHILASQDPESGMMCYYIPLISGSAKTYSTPFDSFWCCVGTGMENHAKYGESIYFHDADSLYVNLFISSVLSWKEKGMTIRQETRFPEENRTILTLSGKSEFSMPLRVRCPGWAPSGLKIRINGIEKVVESQPGQFTVLDEPWKDGDRIEITLPMNLRLESMPDNPKRVAIFYGPILLSGDLGADDQPKPERVPVFVVQGKALDEWVKPVEGKSLVFCTSGVGRPEDVQLIPFYQMHHRRYAVYWDSFAEDEWKKREEEYLAQQKYEQELEARTVDVLRIGEMQPEREHHLLGEKTSAGEFQGRKWRHAADGGWFSFEMKVVSGEPQNLLCTYWGSDSGRRAFDVLVDGNKIATQVLNNNQSGKFYDEAYPLPKNLTEGKQTVTIRFQAHPGNMAGGLFGCRVVKKEE